MKWAAVVAGIGLAVAMPAQAETLRISGLRPAASDEAAALRSIAVERFDGPDGAQLAYAIEDQLRRASVGGEPWLTVVASDLAGEADATLQGYAQPRLTETFHTQQRDACIARDEDGECTQRGQVEAECTTVHLALRAAFRLVAHDGRLLWSQDMLRTQDFAYCPDFDEAPQVDAVVDGWLDGYAGTIRTAFVPYASADNTRILESRDGLARPLRSRLSQAIRLTERDPAAACNAFAQLLAESPASATLTYNVGLCAESMGEWERARSHYRAALAFGRSRERAERGLWRISMHERAEAQIARR